MVGPHRLEVHHQAPPGINGGTRNTRIYLGTYKLLSTHSHPTLLWVAPLCTSLVDFVWGPLAWGNMRRGLFSKSVYTSSRHIIARCMCVFSSLARCETAHSTADTYTAWSSSLEQPYLCTQWRYGSLYPRHRQQSCRSRSRRRICVYVESTF